MQTVRFYSLFTISSRRITSFSCLNQLPCLTSVYKHFYCTKPLKPVQTNSRVLFSTNSEKITTNSDQSTDESDSPEDQWQEYEKELKQLGLVKRLTKFFKDYWYIGLPTAGCVSLFLFGALYFIATLVDIKTMTKFMRKIHVPETINEKLEKSEKVGSIAIALILYKIASPIRYFLQLYLGVLVTKFLVRRGYVKPFPSKHRLKKIIQEKVVKSKDRMNV